jgi:hypothetical protein
MVSRCCRRQEEPALFGRMLFSVAFSRWGTLDLTIGTADRFVRCGSIAKFRKAYLRWNLTSVAARAVTIPRSQAVESVEKHPSKFFD